MVKRIFRFPFFCVCILIFSQLQAQIGSTLSNANKRSAAPHSIKPNDLVLICSKKTPSNVYSYMSSLGWEYRQSSNISDTTKMETWALDVSSYYDDRAMAWMDIYYVNSKAVMIIYNTRADGLIRTFDQAISSSGFRPFDASDYYDGCAGYKSSSYLLFISENDGSFIMRLTSIGSLYDPLNGKKTEYNSDGGYQTFTLDNGKLSGLVKYYNSDGTLVWECMYKNDKQDGVYKEYHENKQLAVSGQYKQGNPIGKFSIYYAEDEGKLSEEINYNSAGEITAQNFYTYESDRRILIASQNKDEWMCLNKPVQFRDAETIIAHLLPDRPCITYYHCDGELNGRFVCFVDTNAVGDYVHTNDTTKLQKFCVGKFKNNLPCDTYYYYYESGQLSKMVPVRDGMVSGIVKSFTFNGDVALTEEYENGKKNGESHSYYLYDTITNVWKPFESISHYEDGLIEGECVIYYENHRISSIMNFHEDILDGLIKKYSPNGELVLQTNFSNGEMDGTATRYYLYDTISESYEKMFLEQQWLEGNRHGRYHYCSPVDSVCVDGNYYKGKRNGKWSEINDSLSHNYSMCDDKYHGLYSIYKHKKGVLQFNDTSVIKRNVKDDTLVFEANYSFGNLKSLKDCRQTQFCVEYKYDKPSSMTVAVQCEDSVISVSYDISKWERCIENFDTLPDQYDDFCNRLGNMWKSNTLVMNGDFSISDSIGRRILCQGSISQNKKQGKWDFYFYEQKIRLEVKYDNGIDANEVYYDLEGNLFSGKFEYNNPSKKIKEVRKIKDGILISGKTKFYDIDSDKKLKDGIQESEYIDIKNYYKPF